MTQAPPKKVLFILPALTAGGAERVLITLMNSLDREKFTPEFLTISAKGPMRDLIALDIPFHCLEKEKVSRALPALFKSIKAIKPDIVVSTMAHVNYGVLLMKPFFPKTKFIVREAITPSYFDKAQPRFKHILRAAYKILYPRADLVISPAQIIIDEFKSDLNMRCKNHVLLRNPVYMAAVRKDADRPSFISEKRKKRVHFMAAGRLHEQKGFDRLIEALSSADMPYDWQLVIWGQGGDRLKLENLIHKHNLSDHIKMPGLTSTPWPVYAQADCFVMPSRFEGLPNVVLESLACGTPVIATRASGGIEEIAAVSPQGAVNVVDTMLEFIEAMQQIKPDPHETYRPSLLPQEFDRKTIVKRFEGMLEGVL